MSEIDNSFDAIDGVDGWILDSNQTDEKKPTELVYKLDWTTRDEIILLLNRYTRLLYGEKNETNEKLMYENIDLYQVLISLSLKSDSNAPTESDGRSGKVVLDLSASARLKITSILMANQSLIVDGDSASEERKMQLAEKNGELVASLSKLPVSVTTGSADENVSNDHADRLTKRAELVEEVARLKKAIEEHIAKNSKLTKTIEEQAAKITVLGREIVECRMETKRIKEVKDLNEVVKMLESKIDLSVHRKKTDFEYELTGVDAFLGSTATRCSKWFLAGGLAWYLLFQMKVEGEVRSLSIYLYVKNYRLGSEKWSTDVSADFSILSQSGGENCSRKFSKKFDSNDVLNWGYSTFITASKLRTSGYIKEDKIKVRLALELGELVRTE